MWQELEATNNQYRKWKSCLSTVTKKHEIEIMDLVVVSAKSPPNKIGKKLERRANIYFKVAQTLVPKTIRW